jgi:hypothetical protein
LEKSVNRYQFDLDKGRKPVTNVSVSRTLLSTIMTTSIAYFVKYHYDMTSIAYFVKYHYDMTCIEVLVSNPLAHIC